MSHDIVPLAFGTLSPGTVTAITVGYLIGGLLCLAVSITGFGGKSTGRRVLNGIVGVACLGYAAYLQFGDSETVFISWYIMLLPLLVLIQAIMAFVRSRSAATPHGNAGGPQAGYPQQGQYPPQAYPQQGPPQQAFPQQPGAAYPGAPGAGAPQSAPYGQQPGQQAPGWGGAQPGAPAQPGGYQPGAPGQPAAGNPAQGWPGAGAAPSGQPAPPPPTRTDQPLWPSDPSGNPPTH